MGNRGTLGLPGELSQKIFCLIKAVLWDELKRFKWHIQPSDYYLLLAHPHRL